MPKQKTKKVSINLTDRHDWVVDKMPKTKKCLACGGKSEFMFKLNAGIFCDNCKDIALLRQEQDLSFERLRERMASPVRLLLS